MLRHRLILKILITLDATLNCCAINVTRPEPLQPEPLQNATTPCDALVAAGLEDLVLFPTDDQYEPRIQSYWALNARLHPWCLVLPQNAFDVSLVLTTLLADGQGTGDWHIALRSGGHSSSGSNNIVNGITIDLSLMNSSTYHNSSNTARLEPGGRWEDVYANLEKENVTVAGGRDGDVGVGGFLLGGGISFYSEKMGFSCDTIINYQVVLANGSIINANETANSDLYRALKGGSNNFGIVTRFDLEAIPSRRLLYDFRIISADYSDIVIDTVVNFANHNESLGENTFVTFLTQDPSTNPNTTMGTMYINTVGDISAKTSFDNVRSLPAYVNTTALQTMADAAADHKLAGGAWNLGMTLTFKNDPEILQYAVKAYDEFVGRLSESIGHDNFTTMVFFQAIPAYLGRLGNRRGGNMLGLEDMENNAILWTGGVAVSSDESALAIARTLANTMLTQIKTFSKAVNGDMDFIYLNYADASQDPLGSYGIDNVRCLRDIAAKYDPTGAFQRRIPGGFKIGRVA